MTTDASRLIADVKCNTLVDISPVVAWFRDELQRARDQLAVERTAASSAREALAACEERLRASEVARALANGDAVEARQALTTERVSVAHWTRKAKEFFQERDDLQAKLDEAATAATVAVARPEPRSAEAVKEAIRLLTGNEPTVEHNETLGTWWAAGGIGTEKWNVARACLLRHLEELQPAETVKP